MDEASGWVCGLYSMCRTPPQRLKNARRVRRARKRAVEGARALVETLSREHSVPAPRVEVRRDLAPIAMRFGDCIFLSPQALRLPRRELAELVIEMWVYYANGEHNLLSALKVKYGEMPSEGSYAEQLAKLLAPKYEHLLG